MATIDHKEILDFISFPELTAATLPAEEQSALASLSKIEIPGWADGQVEDYRRRIAELEAHIATLHSLHNTCAPVSSLPNEVLGAILSDSSLNNGGLRIRNVCRRWRSVLLETPQIWADRISRRFLSTYRTFTSRSTYLDIAIRRSGALPLSIYIASKTELWRLSSQRARIAELTVEPDTSSRSSAVVDFLCSGGMDRLHTLRLKRTYLPSRTFINILEACPRLKYLKCGIRTLGSAREDHNLASGERALHLPHLRELTICGVPLDALRIVRLFKSICAHTRVNLDFDVETQDGLPSFEFPQVLSPPPVDQLCIEPVDEGEDSIPVARGYVESGVERLRISGQTSVLRRVEALFRSISILIVNFNAGRCELCKCVIREWNLPFLCRLEISQTTPSATKRMLTALFLDRHGHRASELSVVWVLPLIPGQEEQLRAAAELRTLVDLLQDHIDSRKPRLGTLELHAVERYELWKAFTGSIEEGSDARLCTKVVAPFLAKLQAVVDVVHVG